MSSFTGNQRLFGPPSNLTFGLKGSSQLFSLAYEHIMNAYDAYVCWWCQSLLPVMVPLGPLFREDYYLIASGIGFNTDAALICLPQAAPPDVQRVHGRPKAVSHEPVKQRTAHQKILDSYIS